MRIRLAAAFGLLLLFSGSLFCQNVRFATSLGNIDVQLLPDSAPQTVANFMNYVNKGAYDNSFFHRSVPGFVIQGGGYGWANGLYEIPQDPPVVNEYRVSNTRGTIAMAKLGNDPNSATNQWFFNLASNTSLNTTNGGFTVFGRIANSSSLTIMDRIAALRVYQAGDPFNELPLSGFTGGTITAANLVLVRSITVLPPGPAITANGVVTASNFGGVAQAAPGSFIEIYGSNLAGDVSRSWQASDFNNGRAPTTLEGVSVTVGGQGAFVTYVSPTQVNVQVPANIATTGQASVVVTYNSQASASSMLTVKPVAAGLLAPPNFKVGDKQYVVAVHSSNGNFVSNGSIPDVAAAPAVPGETLTLYGIGFGAVTPTSTPIAGQVVQGLTSVSVPIQVFFGDIQAEVSYAGLVPDLVGLYQLNVKVPASVPNGDLAVRVVTGSDTLPQALYLPVQAP